MSPLGRGGMGRVYKAFDRVMEEHVALKVLRSEYMRDPAMSRRFVSEIKLARKIGHRNVCRIHEYGEDGDIRFIVMELLTGVTLKEYLHDAPLPPDAAYDVSIQVARGLNAVHELGIVHRDVKTANIMIDEAGVAKLVDFGIAKEVSSDLTDPGAAGMIMCTPEYMSPEQVHGGPGSFDERHLRAGVRRLRGVHRPRPVRGATPVATFLMHLHDDLPLGGEDAERIPPPLVPILERALAKDPEQRYTSVSDFAGAMSAACAAGGFTGARPAGRPAPASDARSSGRRQSGRAAGDPATRRRRLWRWALAAGAIAMAVVLGVAFARRCSVPTPSAVPPPASTAFPRPRPRSPPRWRPKRSTLAIVTVARPSRRRIRPRPRRAVPAATVAAAASGRGHRHPSPAGGARIAGQHRRHLPGPRVAPRAAAGSRDPHRARRASRLPAAAAPGDHP